MSVIKTKERMEHESRNLSIKIATILNLITIIIIIK